VRAIRGGGEKRLVFVCIQEQVLAARLFFFCDFVLVWVVGRRCLSAVVALAFLHATYFLSLVNSTSILFAYPHCLHVRAPLSLHTACLHLFLSLYLALSLLTFEACTRCSTWPLSSTCRLL
jgi:hypothetical protein